MRRKLIIVGAIALVSATLITLLFYNLLSHPLEQQAAEPEMRSVVVAARDLPRGSLLASGMLELKKVEPDNVPDDGYSSISTLEGRRLIEPLSTGDALLPEHLPRGGSQGLGAAIPAGMRGVTVHIEEYAGVAGIVVTGDRVDVLVASAVRAPGRTDVSLKTLLQNIEVLATDRLAEGRTSEKLSANVTLLVDAADAAELSLADQAGSIRLVLRNPADTDTLVAAGSAEAHQVLGVPAPPYQPVRRAPAAQPALQIKPAPESQTLARLDDPARAASAQLVVSLHLRLAGLGDKALTEMTKGLEAVESKSPLLIARFREGWDAEEVFDRLERDGALQVFAAPSFSLPRGRHSAYEQSSETPTITVSKAHSDVDRLGVRVRFGAELSAPGGLLLDVAAQSAMPDSGHSVEIGGAALPRVVVRRAESEIVLADRQSFWIRGLIDRPGAWDLLRRLFPNHPLERDRNDELVILVTPRLLEPGAGRVTAAVVEK